MKTNSGARGLGLGAGENPGREPRGASREAEHDSGIRHSPPNREAAGSKAEGGTPPLQRQASGEPLHLHSDVAELPAELKALIDQMLIEGASCEDAVQAVNERGGEGVTQQAVENYFRGNVPLQQQRIQKLKQTGLLLKRALGDPDSAMHDLAEALLLTGVTEATRANGIARGLAVKLRLEKENLGLKQQTLKMRERNERKRQEYLNLRMRTERARHDKMRAELKQLKEALTVLKKGDKLDAESLRKIREIYGIISEPIIPPEAASH